MKMKAGMDDELRPEYDLSEVLKDGIRGKYADRYREGTNRQPSQLDQNSER